MTLKVEVGPEDLEGIIDATYKDLSKRLNVPGFRKGKVPRGVIDVHVGAENVRMEAIRNGLPVLYLMAVRDSGILPVCDPELNVLEKEGDGDNLVFEARVDVKPEVAVSDYKGIEIEKPETIVSEEDVQKALDEARDRFATLEVIEGRPVEEGDFVLVDYKVFADGEPLEGSSGTDRMIQVGAGEFLPEFDEQLVGARKGDILDIVTTFPPDYGARELAGKPGTFRTMVKEIKKKVLPPLDDAMAREMSRFETLEELKGDLRSQIENIKRLTCERLVRESVVKALADRTFVDVPESMTGHQVEREIDEFAQELGERGITLDEYLEAMKGTRYELEKAIKDRVEDNLKAELILDAVAAAEDIEISDDEAEGYVRQRAEAVKQDPDRAIEEARREGRIPVLKANLRIARAVDFLAENAVFEGGEPVGESGLIHVEPDLEAEEQAAGGEGEKALVDLGAHEAGETGEAEEAGAEPERAGDIEEQEAETGPVGESVSKEESEQE